MKAGAGKLKGTEWERKVAKSLSLWLSGGLKKDWFRRSVGSGSVATVDPDWGSQAGDISATGSEGAILTQVFLIECKHWRFLLLESLLYGTHSLIGKAWAKAKDQAEQHGKVPMLIVREDYKEALVLVDEFLSDNL